MCRILYTRGCSWYNTKPCNTDGSIALTHESHETNKHFNFISCSDYSQFRTFWCRLGWRVKGAKLVKTKQCVLFSSWYSWDVWFLIKSIEMLWIYPRVVFFLVPGGGSWRGPWKTACSFLFRWICQRSDEILMFSVLWGGRWSLRYHILFFLEVRFLRNSEVNML